MKLRNFQSEEKNLNWEIIVPNAMAERSLRQSGGAAPKAQAKYRGVQGHAPSEKIQNPDVNLCDFEHSKKQKVLF